MNAARRKKIAKVIDLLEDAKILLEEIQEEEQNAFDNMPENLQESERGTQMEENIYNLEEGASNIADVIDSIESM